MIRLAGIIAAFLLATVANAAVTPNSFVTPQTPNRGLVQFLQGTDSPGTYKTVYTAGANGSRCYTISVSNNDGSATHLINFRLSDGVTQYGGAQITTTSGAGFSSAGGSPQDGIQAFGGTLPKDAYGNQYIQLKSGDLLQATFATALTASTAIWVYVVCSDF